MTGQLGRSGDTGQATQATQTTPAVQSGAHSGQHLVVIGAGVVGASIAYHLARAGTGAVTIVDRAGPGRGTSSTSFAWVNSSDKSPRPYHRLNAESVTAHRRLRDDVRDVLPDAPEWLHEGGGLELATTDESAATLRAKAVRLQSWNYPIELIDAAEAQRLEPHLRLDGLIVATYCPEEAWVDGPLFAQTLVGAATRLGATIRSGPGAGEVAGFELEGGGGNSSGGRGNAIGGSAGAGGDGASARVSGIRLGDGSVLHADQVVIAAGRWTDRVAALAGVNVPLAPTCGLLAVTTPVAEKVGRVVHVPGMNFRPEPGGGLIVQSGATDETVTEDTPASPTLPGCADLLERVQRYLPTVAGAKIVEGRVGVRPMPADGLSIVGPVAQRPGLYLCVTHSGITLSALLGELVAAEVTAGQPDERLADFRPARCVTA
jgi:glycine/D-amino acid oxidase-like deaminating enzyme